MTTIGQLFDVQKGHQLALNKVDVVDHSDGAVAYVSRSHRNNGVAAWVKPIKKLLSAAPGDISVCLRSRNHALAAFVQPRPFYTTYHVAVLTPKSPMSVQEKLWWCLCIRKNRYRFHFGRQANRTIESLELPDAVPDWVTAAKLPAYSKTNNKTLSDKVDVKEWILFALSDLFDFSTGSHTSRRDLKPGDVPLVSASEWNNGISAYTDEDADANGGQITVANNGSIGAAFFQSGPFAATRDVTILSPKTPLSLPSALFICCILRKESERYNYARKWNYGRMKTTFIKLPSKDGQPDFEVMEALMRSVPFAWALAV